MVVSAPDAVGLFRVCLPVGTRLWKIARPLTSVVSLLFGCGILFFTGSAAAAQDNIVFSSPDSIRPDIERVALTDTMPMATGTPDVSSDSLRTAIKKTKGSERTPEKRHSPSQAAWKAAALPGWGQIYNRKYWKLPIVYGGLGGLGYWVYFNADQHRYYRQAYIAKTDEDPSTPDVLPFASEASILQTKEFYRRQLDASVLITVAFYGLQIIDAVVDAHLFHFDVSDELSLDWTPMIQPPTPGFAAVPGISLRLQTKSGRQTFIP